jgi:hypothetical protein
METLRQRFMGLSGGGKAWLVCIAILLAFAFIHGLVSGESADPYSADPYRDGVSLVGYGGKVQVGHYDTMKRCREALARSTRGEFCEPSKLFFKNLPQNQGDK